MYFSLIFENFLHFVFLQYLLFKRKNACLHFLQIANFFPVCWSRFSWKIEKFCEQYNIFCLLASLRSKTIASLPGQKCFCQVRLTFLKNLMRIPYISFSFNTFFLSVSMLAYISERLLIFFQYVGLLFHEKLKRCVNNIIFSAFLPSLAYAFHTEHV